MSAAPNTTLGFLGGGNMAEAIINGIVESKLLASSDIYVTDMSPERRVLLSEKFGVTALDNNRELLARAGTILFAVKPQGMRSVMEEIRSAATAEHLFLSICAGTRCATIEAGLSHDAAPRPRVVRIMPNTPAMIGLGMAGICGGTHARTEDMALPRRIFEAVGKVAMIDEAQMDALTAVSGSGPAYLFYLIESMIDGARALGFDEQTAKTMVNQTILGAATLATQSPKSAAELRAAVTSPGGTTAAGIHVLETHKVRDAVAECLLAARNRGEELSRQ